MRKTKIRWLVPLIVVALVAAACSSDAEPEDDAAPETTTAAVEESAAEDEDEPEEDAAPADDETETAATDTLATDGTIEWVRCGSLQCATVAVPLDHDNPDGDTIEVAVTRVLATDPDERIGSLLVNFGGPSGESGEIFTDFGPFLQQSFGGRFDIVTWDPRGIGETARLACDDLPEADEPALLVDGSDGYDGELEAIEADFAEMVACAENSGSIINHLSTVDVARDLDLLREALGDEGLTYLGYSYGTQIGWVYATLFPNNVRAMVLDGAVGPGDTQSHEALVTDMTTFQRTMDHFDAACDRTPSCDAQQEGLKNRVERIADELRSNPLDGTEGQPFGAAEFRRAILQTMYLAPDWIGPDLDRWLVETDDGNPSGLIDFVAQSVETSTPGSNAAVLCADGLSEPEAGWEAYFDEVAAVSSTFGSVPPAFNCASWTGEVTPLPTLDTSGAPKILVVGNTLDPITSIEDAVALDEQLDDSVLLTFEGAGHTIVAFDPCVDEIALAYFDELVTPEPGTVCRPPTGLLGIAFSDTASIDDVQDGSAAAEAGLQAGDLITAVDGVAVSSLAEVPFFSADQVVVFTIDRDGEELEFEVKVGAREWS